MQKKIPEKKEEFVKSLMNRAIHECTDIKNGDMLETKFGFDQILLNWKTLRIFYFGYLTDEKSS